MKPKERPDAKYLKLLRSYSAVGGYATLIVVAVGFLYKFGLLKNPNYAGDLILYILSACYIIAMILNCKYRTRRSSVQHYRNHRLALNIAYHIISVLFILFVTGINSPIYLAWIILTVIAEANFGTIGLVGSLVAYCYTILIGILTQHNSTENQIAAVTSIILITMICLMVSKIKRMSDKERAALSKAHSQLIFQRQRLSALVNSMGDAVIATTENGKIKVYNAAALGLLDTNVDIMNKNIDDMLKLIDSNGKHFSLTQETRKHHIFNRTDLQLKLRGGEKLRLYVNATTVQPGYMTSVEYGKIYILRDITKEKTLEDERDEFVSVASHELRTPVTIVEGNLSNLQLLLERGAPPESIKSAANAAHEQTLFLAKLVNDLSALSRAERGVGGEMENVDLNELIATLYDGYSKQAVAKGLKLNIDVKRPLPVIRSSRLYIEELMQNLVTNAIKYTHEGHVDIVATTNKNGIQIQIKDTGIGISQADQKHIFEKFYRSEDYRTRETTGTGLGLYVCKKLAEKLQSELEFESRLNHGSTFLLRIPAKQIIPKNNV